MQKKYKLVSRLNVVCPIINDGSQNNEYNQNIAVENRNKYKINLENICLEHNIYTYYMKVSSIDINFGNQGSEYLYGNSDIWNLTQPYALYQQLFKGYIQLTGSNVVDFDSFYLNCLIPSDEFPGTGLKFNQTMNSTTNYKQVQQAQEVGIIAQYSAIYNIVNLPMTNITIQQNIGVGGITNTQATPEQYCVKIYLKNSRKFKVDGQNLDFQFTTDDPTGKNKRPIPLQNTMSFQKGLSFNVQFKIYKRFKC